MALLFVCSRGHQWQADAALPADDSRDVACPYCGSAGKSQETLATAPTIDDDQGTLPAAAVPPLVDQVPTLELPTRAMAAPTDGLAPEWIGNYQIVGELGRGGMGVVYKARQQGLDRLVAVKMILASKFAHGQAVGRFRQEAEAVARLQHPNIVQIYEIGEHEGRPYFALEYVAGNSLSRTLAGRPQPPQPAARFIQTLSRAVAHAHRRGIVHRDLTPANILLAADEAHGGQRGASPGDLISGAVPKITDFGLAKRLDADGSQTVDGTVMGTPNYMSPEQASGRIEAIGPKTDVYALGAVLYELLTGRPPFVGETVLATVDQVIHREPLPPSYLQPRIPRDLETICLKCLEKDPTKRYASADDLADDLERFLQQRPILARRTTVVGRAWKWSKRRPTAAALIAVSAAALVALVLGSQWYSAQVHWQRNQAEQNFTLAMIAMDGILDEFGENTLTYEPGAEKQRQLVLQRALPVYEQFLLHRGHDPRLRTEAARAYQRMGDVERWLGNHDKARRAYKSALSLLAGEISGMSDAARRRRQAYCFNHLGEVERVAGTPQDAMAAYDEAIRIQRQLVAEEPASPDCQQELARTYYNLAILYRETDRPDESERLLKEAIERLQDLVGQHDRRADYRQELARAYLNLGPVLRSTRRTAHAVESYGKAIELLQKLTAVDPRRPDYRYELAVAHTNRGNALLGDSAHADAKKDYQFARDTLEKLVSEYPHVPMFAEELANTENSLAATLARTEGLAAGEAVWLEAARRLRMLANQANSTSADHGRLGMTLSNLGWLYQNKQDWSQAEAHLHEAKQSLGRALSTNPNHPDYRLSMRNSQRMLSELLLARGDHAAAAVAADELVQWSGDAPADRFRAACVLAQAGLIADTDEKLAPEQRSRRAQERFDEAARLMEELNAADFQDGKLLEQRKDSIAAALERHDALRAAFSRLEAAVNRSTSR